jgi:regulator of replication initiation timing
MADQAVLTKKLQSLEEKVLQLIASCDILKIKLEEARQENIELKVVIRKQGEEMKALQKKQVEKANHFHNQDKISKIVELTFADKDNPNGLKEKLDEYIREIDQCITLLSK